MARVLVAFASKYGSTAEIAEALGSSLRTSGHDVDVRAAGSVGSVDDYRAVVVGSAVYMGRWRGEALRFLRHHRDSLGERDVWLFSSGPVGEGPEDTDEADTDRWTRPRKVQELAGEIGAHEHVVFGGKVDEDRGPMRKRMAHDMPRETRDRRDWDRIAEWATGIASTLPAGPSSPSPSADSAHGRRP